MADGSRLQLRRRSYSSSLRSVVGDGYGTAARRPPPAPSPALGTQSAQRPGPDGGAAAAAPQGARARAAAAAAAPPGGVGHTAAAARAKTGAQLGTAGPIPVSPPAAAPSPAGSRYR